ncbi:MAG: hypothetical protein HYV09_06905 [Deltaproteobacteria bacterium]|nr:hypothetical protein [Deltaproteobacteria bacterium]
MKHVLFTAGFLFAAGLLVGCTPSPEKVCNHYSELEGEKKKSKDGDEEMAKLEKELKELCPKMLKAVKEENADAYKCYAKCVVGTSELATAKKCDKDCEGFDKAANKAMGKLLGLDDEGGKKKASKSDDESSDDDSKKSKKKKKSSDDE